MEFIEIDLLGNLYAMYNCYEQYMLVMYSLVETCFFQEL